MDVDSLSTDEIQTYLNMPGLNAEAYEELRAALRMEVAPEYDLGVENNLGRKKHEEREALRKKQYKPGIDRDEKRKQRRDYAKENLKSMREAGTTARRQGGTIVNGEPALDFNVVEDEGETEYHRIYVQPKFGGGGILMIASIPLAVGEFILEMDQRFSALETEYTNMKNKNIRGGTKRNEFDTAKTDANNQLTAANSVFANNTSTITDKLDAEKTLAFALHELIKKAFSFAKRLGSHFSTPGNSKHAQSVDTYYYTRQLSEAALRYNIEGLVAKYQDQPDYQDSGFERDHQPHNDIIETMAALPEFKGKKMVKVAAGRTQQGWAILLHGTRHAAGRTYGTKGGDVTNQFHTDLQAERPNLKSDGAVRDWCVQYLINSMKADVAAMKTIANDETNSYPDIDGLSNLQPNDRTDMKKRVKKQIIDGEDRILETESLIEDYKN